MSSRKHHGNKQETHPAASSPKNIVVFGESGVGKSSLINQIAGRSIAATSNDAKGCTFQHQKYEFELDDGTPYAIWDTSGLDEGTYGTVPAEIAEENLKHLLRDLTRANGIDLLVYCIRGTRLRKTLRNNYNLFYSSVCRKKVPIVAVVTGLEHYEEEMDGWWTMNQSEFAKLKMHFDGHACVTTLNANEEKSRAVRQRCHASRQAVLDVVADTCARDRWGFDNDGWVSATLTDVRATFRPSRQKNSLPQARVVAIYDLVERLPQISSREESTEAVSSPLPFEGGQLMDVGGCPLLVYRIRDNQLGVGARFQKQVAPRGADLLIFCASIRTKNTGTVWRCAEEFYRSYGGDTRPFLVVVQDAPSDEVASQWWEAFGEDREKVNVRREVHHRTQHSRAQQPDAGRVQAIVRALPSLENAREAAVVGLRNVIQRRALQPLDDVPSGCFGWLRVTGRRRQPVRPASAAFGVDSLTNARVWSPWWNDTCQ